MSEPSISRRAVPRSAGRRSAIPAVGVGLLLLLGACADFSAQPATFGVQPSLTPPAANPVEPTPPQVGRSSAPPSPDPSSSASPSESSASASPGSSSPQSSPPAAGSPDRPTQSSSASPSPYASAREDACTPTDPAVIAACLDAPWGLAVLKDGQSALVGERTSGRILQIAPQTDPVEYARIGGIDADGSGGLLGIALSPAFDEDGLIYAYVTTRSDNRILRLAKGDRPKPILTGIPKGAQHNGGRIEFGSEGQLYVGTGDAGDPAKAADPRSLAGKVLRIDEFGRPSKGNPTPASPVYASGFTDVTGMCSLGSTMGALDHRNGEDPLIALKAGTDYSSIESGSAVWRWKKSEGGAADCALAKAQLGFTSLDKKQVVGIRVNQQGTFTGTPEPLVQNTYGRLLTLTLGGGGTDKEIFWATTSNKDGQGEPTASDDRVIVIPAAGGGGGGRNGPD